VATAVRVAYDEGAKMIRRIKRTIQPLGWARPRGYSNAILSENGILFVAGQVGWEPRSQSPRFPRAFAAQFDQALANALEVVRSAGGVPSDVLRMTVYVTDKREYLRARKGIGDAWKRRMGRHYPAMTLVEVSSLLEPGAKVEIEATAVISAEHNARTLLLGREVSSAKSRPTLG
jgi:enamine deaminase RidA (YjgF/YER057c/UK114 family)